MTITLHIHPSNWAIVPPVIDKINRSTPDVDLNQKIESRHITILCLTLIIDKT